jgi:hypothetical protein
MEAIEFTGVVGSDGLVHPPEGMSLPEGEFEVSLRPRTNNDSGVDPLAPTRSWLLRLAAMAEAAKPGNPDDMAENHDHYAHGKPRE